MKKVLCGGVYGNALLRERESLQDTRDMRNKDKIVAFSMKSRCF